MSYSPNTKVFFLVQWPLWERDYFYLSIGQPWLKCQFFLSRSIKEQHLHIVVCAREETMVLKYKFHCSMHVLKWVSYCIVHTQIGCEMYSLIISIVTKAIIQSVCTGLLLMQCNHAITTNKCVQPSQILCKSKD